jgi:hypothetical protein
MTSTNSNAPDRLCLAPQTGIFLLALLLTAAFHPAFGVESTSTALPDDQLLSNLLDSPVAPADAVRGYLLGTGPIASTNGSAAPTETDSAESDQSQTVLPDRLNRIRLLISTLGKAGDYDRACDLLSAGIASGYGQPWMYQALAIASACADRPPSEIARVVLSAADSTQDPIELTTIATRLSELGLNKDALRLCLQAVSVDDNYGKTIEVGLKLAKATSNAEALAIFCIAALRHNWPVEKTAVADNARHSVQALIAQLNSEGRQTEAENLQKNMAIANERDLVVEVSWNGDADLDLLVQEPPGTLCSYAAPYTTSGGTLMPDSPALPSREIRSETYTATAAFPGTYQACVRRSSGEVTAGLVTIDITFFKGTPHEKVSRKTLVIEGDDLSFSVILPQGRRLASVPEAQLAHDTLVQKEVGKEFLAQQLRQITDAAESESLVDSLAASRNGSPQGGGSNRNYTTGRSVGYQPSITVLPEGLTMNVLAVVSGDRRYVRITANPSFTSYGNVNTFSYAGGGGGGGGLQQGGGGLQQGGLQQGGLQQGGLQQGGLQQGGLQQGGGGLQQGGGRQQQLCWVAREVYGADNPKWLLFREWLLRDAPTWMVQLYGTHGEAFAAWIHDKPAVKESLAWLMDKAID